MPPYPPGPKSRPFVGNFPEFRANPLAFLESCAQYGDLSHARFGAYHVYLVNHPDLIHQVLVSDCGVYNKSRILKRTTRELIGDGLLTSEGDFHKRQRRMIQPAFHHQRIASYAEIMTRRTAAMLESWPIDQPMDISRQMMKLTLQIVSEALFGADVSAEAEKIGEAISLGIETVGGAILSPLRTLPIWIPSHNNRERVEAAEYIRGTIMRMIEARQREGNLQVRSDLLSMLLLAMDDETCATMTPDQVYDEAVTLFIAGHETTAIALSWTLYLLSQNPDVESWLLEEVETLADRAPTLTDLHALKRVEWTVKESMRLYPPAWIISRLPPNGAQLGGYNIVKNSGVLISPWVTHRDPRWFGPDALQFRPKRWIADESGMELDKRIPRYAYFPFGGGPRVCIGQPFAMMEMQLLVPMILQRYHLTLVRGQHIKPDPLVTLRPKHGIQMQAHPRTPTPSLDAPLAAIAQPALIDRVAASGQD